MLDDSNNERLKRNTDTPLASIRKCGGCIQLAIRKKREAWSVYAISGDRASFRWQKHSLTPVEGLGCTYWPSISVVGARLIREVMNRETADASNCALRFVNCGMKIYSG